MDFWSNVSAVIASLGGSRSGGINWTWAYFPEQEAAEAFDWWCGKMGLETRGVYPPHWDENWGVRYR